MSDEPARDTEPRGQDRPRPLHSGARALAWAMFASLALHMSPLLTLLNLDIEAHAPDIDTEWFGDFEELQAVGHGSNQRWAQIRAPEPKPPEPPEEPPPEEKKEEPPPEEVKEPEEVKPPKEEEERVEPPKKPKKPKKKPAKKKPKKKKKPPKELAAKKTAPKKAAPEETEKPPAKKTPTEKPEDKNKDNEATAVVSQGPPGLDRRGPSDLPAFDNYAPGNARMSVLLRLDRLRGTPYEAPTGRLLDSVPDFRILLEDTDIEPMKDFDAIFSATADPRYIQESFMVVRHSLGEQGMKDVLGQRYEQPPEWKTYRGYPIRDMVPNDIAYKDTRKVLLASQKVALVTRKEWLGTLTEDQPEDSALRPERSSEEELPKFTMLAGLEQIEEAAPEDTIAMVSVRGLYFMVPGYGRLPRFEAARLAIVGVKKPTLTIDIQFKDKAKAAKFAKDCPRIKSKLVDSIPGARFMKLDAYVTKLKCEPSEQYVTVSGQYTQAELLRALQLAAPFMPRPPALADLPAPPPRTPAPATPDMGAAPPVADMGAASPDMAASVDMAKNIEEASADMGGEERPDMGVGTSDTEEDRPDMGAPPEPVEPAAEDMGAPPAPTEEDERGGEQTPPTKAPPAKEAREDGDAPLPPTEEDDKGDTPEEPTAETRPTELEKSEATPQD